MRCERCHRLMIVDHFLDLEDDGGHLWLRAWGCANCRSEVEPGMAERGAVHRTLLARLRERWAKQPSVQPEVVPIGV
jgi:hypothetical protein